MASNFADGVGARRPVFIAPRRRGFPPRLIPAVLAFYACLLPRELTFEIFEVAFQPYRVVLTLAVPYVIYQAMQQRMRASFVDCLVIFAASWMFLALCITETIGTAVITGLSDGLNLSFAYFAGRVSLRNSADFRSFVYAAIPGLAACGLLVAIESITHTHIFRPFVASVTGFDTGIYSYETRMGLMRAFGPFPHPILAGVFLASFIPLVWYVAEGPVARIIGSLAVSCFYFSLSSGSYLVAIVAVGLIFTNFLHRTTKLPVFPAVLGGVLFCMVIISVFSEGGLFKFIIRHMTLNPATGYFRLLIWEYGGAEANNHPIFGIGTRQYSRPSWMHTGSVDAHWLVLALRYGYPASGASLLIMLSSAVLSLRGAWSPFPLDQRVAYAISYSIFGVVFAAWTVYLWEGVFIWITVLTGMGVTFGQQMARAAHLKAKRAVPAKAKLRPRLA